MTINCFSEKTYNVCCKIFFLDDGECELDFRSSVKGQVLLDAVLEKVDLDDPEYFSLRYSNEGAKQSHWLDPNRSLRSQLHGEGPHLLYFGVKYYPIDPCQLDSEMTRYQLFLQVRRDIQQGRLPVTFDEAGHLGSLCVQSQLGDYDPKRQGPGYVSDLKFVPNQTMDLEDRIAELHQSLRGKLPATVEYLFLDKVKWMELYGIDLYTVTGDGAVEYQLGIGPQGVLVYRGGNKVANYFWTRLIKVSRKSRIFLIRTLDKSEGENVHAFELASDAAAKHLLRCCVDQHSFFKTSRSQMGSAAEKRKSAKGKSSSESSSGAIRCSQSSMRSVHNVSFKNVNNDESPSSRNLHDRRGQYAFSSLMSQNQVIRPVAVADGIVGLAESRHAPGDRPTGYASDPEGSAATRAHLIHSAMAEQNGWSGRSPGSARSLPWTDNRHRGGLYTTGRESPMSAVSERIKFPSRYPSNGALTDVGAVSEYGGEREHRRRHRCRHHNHRRHRHSSDAPDSHQHRHSNKYSLPDHISSHIHYELVEPPANLTTGQLRSQIPYTQVRPPSAMDPHDYASMSGSVQFRSVPSASGPFGMAASRAGNENYDPMLRAPPQQQQQQQHLAVYGAPGHKPQYGPVPSLYGATRQPSAFKPNPALAHAAQQHLAYYPSTNMPFIETVTSAPANSSADYSSTAPLYRASQHHNGAVLTEL